MYTVFFRIKLSKGGTKGIDEIVFFLFFENNNEKKENIEFERKKNDWKHKLCTD